MADLLQRHGAAVDPPPGPPATRRTWAGLDRLDALVLAALTAAAWWTRRHGLPVDGLWFDDSWPGAGPTKGSWSQLLIVQSGHPGFSAILMGVARVTSGSSALGVPAFVAGILGPPAIYWTARSSRFVKPVAAVVAAALVAADIPILYAGRVKTYTIDLLVVAGLLLIVPRLARLRWRWPTAILWTIAALAVGSISGFSMAATATAALVLVVHRRDDLRYRFAAMAVQAAGQYALVQILHSRSDLEDLEASQELYDAHFEWEWNPFSLVAQILRHLRRIAVVYPGGTRWSTMAIGIVAVAGLALASVSGRARVHVRYAATLVLVTFGAAFFGLLPFGPGDWYPADWPLPRFPLSRGERGSIWLVPAIAIGVAAALHGARQLVARRWRRPRTLRIVDGALWAVAAVLVIGGLATTPPRYPLPGNASATRYIESELTDGDVVMLTSTSVYSFLVETDLRAELEATPERHIGYTPVYPDDPVYTFGGFGRTEARPAVVEELAGDTRRAFVLDSIPGLSEFEIRAITRGLKRAGLELDRVETFGAVEVLVFER